LKSVKYDDEFLQLLWGMAQQFNEQVVNEDDLKSQELHLRMDQLERQYRALREAKHFYNLNQENLQKVQGAENDNAIKAAE